MQTTTNIENKNRKGKKMEKAIIRQAKNGKYHLVGIYNGKEKLVARESTLRLIINLAIVVFGESNYSIEIA
jgi:hypothetical protein